jgi:beta-glucosidase
VTAPWSIFVADDTAEVHLTTVRQTSPQGAVTVQSNPDGSAASWSGTQRGLLTMSGRASDMRPQAGKGVGLTVRYRVDRTPTERVKLGMRCTESLCGTPDGAMLDVTPVFKSARAGTWQTLTVPLSCFSAAGADLASVVAPFALETAGSFGVTIAQVNLAQRAPGPAPKCPPAI